MRLHVSIAALILIALSLSAHAENAPNKVTSQLNAFIVSTDEKGVESFEQAKRAKPGDTIEYRIEHANNTKGALSSFIVLGPVPKGTSYVPASASSILQADLEVQVEKLGWNKPPVYRTEKDESGKDVKVEVPSSEYKAIRWLISEPVAVEKSTHNKYRVKVAQ